ncbi:hypothetical protein EQG63_01420 [Flavobacterium amnicola]|uniref:Uncharacterized protein n=1 Tax=Flavobacterium amnicola TaxID=2506422 RepID=A0A4Q1K632_9FLAO|nr:hypothetical protein EQG63_01420 [Flavobacterium amnicola]
MREKGKAKSTNIKVILAFAFWLLPFASNAQCAMCRASLESSGETTQAQAVNDGILYLMAIPYILVGIVALYIYRMYSKKRKV